MTENSNPVIDVARSEQDTDSDGIVTFSTGVRVKLHPVKASLISKVTAKIKDPRVPTWYNKAKGRDERNPNDPAYLRDVERAAQERGNAAMDAMAMFGIELVDGLPEDTDWITKLRLLSITFNADDPIECEFYYKIYEVIGNDDWPLVSAQSGISQEDIAQAEKSFRSDTGESAG